MHVVLPAPNPIIIRLLVCYGLLWTVREVPGGSLYPGIEPRTLCSPLSQGAALS